MNISVFSEVSISKYREKTAIKVLSISDIDTTKVSLIVSMLIPIFDINNPDGRVG